MAFNLVDEPWLNLRRKGGGVEDCSLLTALLDADRYEGLVVDLPTQTPALLRQVLLPIVLDALGPVQGAGQWQALLLAGAFSEEQRKILASYLEEHGHRFDLFDEQAPFAQVAGLRTAKDETKGSALLVATAATGNNVPLFAVRTEGDPLPLTPAQAARWLLHTHCWDTAAIKTGVVGDPQVKAGKTTGNPTGPLGQLGVVLPTGRTLYETLVLNLPISGSFGAEDLPQWRRAPAGPGWESRSAKGLLDLWTWQSRRIRLVPEQTPEGVRVTRVVIAAGDRLRETPDFEPHTTWDLQATGKAKDGPPRRARRHQPGKAAWRGLDGLLALGRESTDPTKKAAGYATSTLLDQLQAVLPELPERYPLQVELTGMSYGTQSSVVDDVLFDAIPLPLTALDPDSLAYAVLMEVADQAEQLARAVNNLSSDLRRAAGADPIPWDKGQRPGELVLHALDPLVRRLLAGIRDAGEDEDRIEGGQAAWEQLAWRRTRDVAEQVISTAAPEVFAGRTVTHNGKEVTYRLATAQQNFDTQLTRILFRAAQAARERRDAQREGRAQESPEPTTAPAALAGA